MIILHHFAGQKIKVRNISKWTLFFLAPPMPVCVCWPVYGVELDPLVQCRCSQMMIQHWVVVHEIHCWPSCHNPVNSCCVRAGSAVGESVRWAALYQKLWYFLPKSLAVWTHPHSEENWRKRKEEIFLELIKYVCMYRNTNVLIYKTKKTQSFLCVVNRIVTWSKIPEYNQDIRFIKLKITHLFLKLFHV